MEKIGGLTSTTSDVADVVESETGVCGWNRGVRRDRFGLVAGRRALIGDDPGKLTDSPPDNKEGGGGLGL